MASATISLDIAKTCKKYIHALQLMQIKSKTGAHKHMTTENILLIGMISDGRRAGCPQLLAKLNSKKTVIKNQPCKQFIQRGKSTICL